MKKSILVWLLCGLSTTIITAQIKNVFEGPSYLDTVGVLTIYSNNGLPSNAIYAEGNGSGLAGNNNRYSQGFLAGFSYTWANYGVWGHQSGIGAGGQGGLFTYGADRNNPGRFAALATSVYGLRTNGPVDVLDPLNAADFATRFDITARHTGGAFPSLGGFYNSSIGAGIFANSGSGINVVNQAGGFTTINASAFNVSSDRSIKKDIENIDATNDGVYMEYLRNIESASFRYLTESDADRPVPHIGVIAQTLPAQVQVEVNKYPDGSSDEMILGMSIADLLGLTLVGVKHLDHKNMLKDVKILELESKINELEAHIDVQAQELSAIHATLATINKHLIELTNK